MRVMKWGYISGQVPTEAFLKLQRQTFNKQVNVEMFGSICAVSTVSQKGNLFLFEA